jgi:hypothetical protein
VSIEFDENAQLGCCDHAVPCAVHEQPYDGQYVPCTCAIASGSIRHRHTYRRRPTHKPEQHDGPNA